MVRSLLALFVFIISSAVVISLAQPPGQKLEAQDKKADGKDHQASFEPKAKPGAGQKFLEKFVGDWSVEKTFYPRKGEPTHQKGQCRQTMIHDGRFLQSEFTFDSESGKTTGSGLIGFEVETGKFTSVWVDSRQTRMSFRQADGKFDGDQIVLLSKELDASEGRRSRTVTKLVDDGKKIVHRQFSIGTDKDERVVMELVLTRR